MENKRSVCRDVRELPISETIKEFYQKNNASFSDSECATIIWNSSLTLSEKLSSLREIQDATGDTNLKVQIQARLDVEAETERVFMSLSNNYIHMVQLDDDKDADSVFTSVDAAVLHGKENCEETFKICKVVLEDALDPNAEDNVLLGGEAKFKKDGTLISCDIYYSREKEFTIVNAVTPTSFEDAYIPVLNPFEYGDSVRIMGDSRLAVVTTSQQDWQRRKEHLKKRGFHLTMKQTP